MTRFGCFFLVAVLGFMAPSAGGTGEQDRGRLNVLFITVDDMNWDSIGAFGCRVDGITPNIDRLASQGMRFQHGHVTIAICQPTRAVWMTGRYPHRSGALGFDRINPGVPTLIETLKKHGYLNGILAKERHVVPSRHAAFDVIVPAAQLKTGRDPQLYYQQTKSFLEKAKASKKPFFLMANAQDPHRPFAGSAQEAGRKRRNKNTIPGVSRTYKPDEIMMPGFLPDLPQIRLELSEYFTSVHRADEVTGAVLRALRESGFEENTLVMFVSDHGMPLPFAKTNCWYQSTRTPWIVRWPGVVKAGSWDREHFVSGIDFTPTILDAAGIPPIKGVDGRTFVPVMKGEKHAGREVVFTHINRTAGRNEYPMRSVQDATYGYIYNAWSDGKTRFRNESQSGRTMKAMSQAAASNPKIAARVKHFLYRTPEELYEYSKDPDARNNLAGKPEHGERLARYRRILLEHMEKTGDPQLEGFRRFLAANN